MMKKKHLPAIEENPNQQVFARNQKHSDALE
jgi:hypothetical protein